ncbi:putative Co/Zn/Cd efflux system membrane fusion protein [Piscinibacter sakaiensis]|uniref:Putative Co/Zn/Cd efflux system membrane fusion protein n=1 Tax=Piscinibacter sakaiensis TaxID=1547922 RepID=A0A0K8P3V3_PISS1|nr:putative Co/Zn/Cd efflux system membrane fusion protein [Piscinibacter sakaiensis]
MPPPPGRPRRRGLGTLVAVLALGALLALAWTLTHRPAATPAGGPPGAGGPGPGGPGGGPGGPGGAGGRGGGLSSTVAVVPARRADVPVLLDSLGTVVPMATVTVRPQVSGPLLQVLFKEGELVKKGQLLATIDPRPYEMALMQATGARQRDEAQLENAKLTLQRYRTLLAQDSIARQDVDTQAALVRQLEGTVVTDRANEGTARLNLGYTRIVAPISGRVGLRTVDAGNLVTANDATGLAVITQVAPIDVQFTLPQDKVQEVMQRLADGPLPARALDRTRVTLIEAGRFSTLDNLVDTSTGTVKAKARFANEQGRLFPNQFVNVQLELRTLKDAVVVPVTAVRNGADGDFVYVLNPDRTVSQRPVRRGQATPELVVITRGLEAGEPVVTEGADRLRDGARVQVGGDAASSPGRGASRPGGGERRRRGEAGAAAASGAGAPVGAASGAAGPAGWGASGAGDGARPRRERAASGAGA